MSKTDTALSITVVVLLASAVGLRGDGEQPTERPREIVPVVATPPAQPNPATQRAAPSPKDKERAEGASASSPTYELPSWDVAELDPSIRKRMVLLTTANCGPCERFKRTVLSDPDVRAELGSHFVACEADVADWVADPKRRQAPRVLFVEPNTYGAALEPIAPPRDGGGFDAQRFLELLQENR